MPLSASEQETLKRISDNVQYVRDKVVEHDTQLKDIIGNGQPGRMKLAEKAIEELQSLRWKIVGFCMGLTILLELSHVGIEKMLEHVK